MAVNPPFLGNQISQSLFCLDVGRRALNIGGALHDVARRSHLEDALERCDDPASLHAYGLRGSVLARKLVSPYTYVRDVVIGTGRHRLMPGEPPVNGILLPPAFRPAFMSKSAPSPATDDSVVKTDAETDLDADVTAAAPEPTVWPWHFTHDERVEYLKYRLQQSLNHPADSGVVGTTAMWATIPAYAAAATLGCAVGCLVGCIGYGVASVAGHRPQAFTPFVSAFGATAGAGAAMVMFAALTTAPAWLTLQLVRGEGALEKCGVAGIGYLLGAAFGLTQRAGAHVAAWARNRTAKPAEDLPASPALA